MNLPKTLNMARGFERDHKLFYENQSTCGFFGFEFSFQNSFWIFLSTFGLSEICKIGNFQVVSQGILSSSEKTFWSFKTFFWKKNGPINSLGHRCPKTMKFRDLQGSLSWRKFFMAFFGSKQEVSNY
jgi:hypothetical protein